MDIDAAYTSPTGYYLHLAMFLTIFPFHEHSYMLCRLQSMDYDCCKEQFEEFTNTYVFGAHFLESIVPQ